MKSKSIYITKDKYAANYEKPAAPMAYGVILILIWLIYMYSGVGSPAQWYKYTIPLRVLSVFWSARLAANMNRAHFDWAFLSFFCPAVVPMILSRLRKLTLPFKIDTSEPLQAQYEELKNEADRLIKRSMRVEAAHIYQYIVDKLPHNSDDEAFLSKLRGWKISRVNAI